MEQVVWKRPFDPFWKTLECKDETLCVTSYYIYRAFFVATGNNLKRKVGQ
jgi:hypothetical protein